MFRQLVVLFFITLELFPLPTANRTKDFFTSPFILIVSLQHAQLLSIIYNLGIRRVNMTFTKREVMNSIQQICLPHPIITKETIYAGRKRNFRPKKILIIKYRKPFKYHPHYINSTKIKNIVLSIDFLSKKNYFCNLNCHRHKSLIK